LQAEGMSLMEHSYTVGQRRGRVWVARFAREAQLDVLPSSEVRRLPALVEGQQGTWAAINGAFYEEGPMGLVVSGGRQEAPATSRGGSGVVAAGPMPVFIVHRDQWRPGPAEALQSIDRLVDRGHSLVNPRADDRRSARSAVAIGEGALWLVATSREESVQVEPGGLRLKAAEGEGLTLSETAALLVELGAVQALNLDGGISTQMAAQVGEQRWTLHGVEGTINALLIRP
jgi:hypothetical protein